MTINFYVNKDDLDQLNGLVRGTISSIDYVIEAYASELQLVSVSSTDNFLNRYFLIGISYNDFMRIEEFLRF